MDPGKIITQTIEDAGTEDSKQIGGIERVKPYTTVAPFVPHVGSQIDFPKVFPFEKSERADA